MTQYRLDDLALARADVERAEHFGRGCSTHWEKEVAPSHELRRWFRSRAFAHIDMFGYVFGAT